jgi:hypothetical protein
LRKRCESDHVCSSNVLGSLEEVLEFGEDLVRKLAHLYSTISTHSAIQYSCVSTLERERERYTTTPTLCPLYAHATDMAVGTKKS